MKSHSFFAGDRRLSTVPNIKRWQNVYFDCPGFLRHHRHEEFNFALTKGALGRALRVGAFHNLAEDDGLQGAVVTNPDTRMAADSGRGLPHSTTLARDFLPRVVYAG